MHPVRVWQLGKHVANIQLEIGDHRPSEFRRLDAEGVDAGVQIRESRYCSAPVGQNCRGFGRGGRAAFYSGSVPDGGVRQLRVEDRNQPRSCGNLWRGTAGASRLRVRLRLQKFPPAALLPDPVDGVSPRDVRRKKKEKAQRKVIPRCNENRSRSTGNRGDCRSGTWIADTPLHYERRPPARP